MTTDMAHIRVLLLCSAAVWTAYLPAPAAGQTGAPSALPGPPPGAGSGLPDPPAPGHGPATPPVGPSATIPARVSGPGLLSGTVRPQRGGRLTLQIACTTRGRVSVSAPAIRAGTLATGSYPCRHRRATAQLSIRTADRTRLARLGSTLAEVILRQGGATQRLSVTLEARVQAPSFWTDGGLQCTTLGDYEAYLVAPNFKVSPSVTIDVRPWVAWYTTANGWRWLGVRGINASRWYRSTATPDGVVEWKTPTGARNAWTWAPIHVPAGRRTYAIGVFEVVYWYSRPTYVWRYTRSSPTLNQLGTYCNYP